jgi:hypothetical protein
MYVVGEDWILKGATALLAREIGVRATIDIDVYRSVGHEEAENDLRAAAALDLGDWFRFEMGIGRSTAGAIDTSRFRVVAYVGETEWQDFHVDLVGPSVQMTGQPDDVPPLAQIPIPDFEQRGYRVYPLVDHIADKVAAIHERHGNGATASTRYKDLVDLVAIVTCASVDAASQRVALTSEFRRRELELPEHFEVPERASWERGYAREVNRSLMQVAKKLDEASAIVGSFVDPLLDETATGSWSPTSRKWADGPSWTGTGYRIPSRDGQQYGGDG